MKKTLLVAAVALSALFAGAASAQDEAGELSFNLAATNNYVWRGVSQTNDGAALQGGVDYSKGMFYVGAWASNVDFGSEANMEVDLYAGITPSAGNFSFDFGYMHYFYPNQGDNEDLNFGELKAAVSHPMGAGSIGFAMYLSADELEDPYYEINTAHPIGDKWTVSGAIGNYEAFDYTTWNAGVTYALTESLSLDVRYSEASKLPSNLYATLKVGF